MAETLPLPPFPATLRGLPREELDRALAVLRAELESTTDRGSRALLGRRLAIAALERGDSASAARYDLAALHDAPGFVESVEALLALALRSRSKTNREKLLARLSEVATNAPCAERAALEAAATAFDEQRYADAIAAVKRAEGQGVKSPTLTLLADFAAAEAGTPEDRERALLARIEDAPSQRIGEALTLRAFRLARGRATSALRAQNERRGWPSDALLEYEEAFAATDGDVSLALDAARELVTSTDRLTGAALAAARLRMVDYGIRLGHAETALDELDAALGSAENESDACAPATLLELSLLAELARELGQKDLAHAALARALALGARKSGAPDASSAWIERLVRLETGAALHSLESATQRPASGTAGPALSSDDPVGVALELVENAEWETLPVGDSSTTTPLQRLAAALSDIASREPTRGGGRAALYVSAFLLELRAASLGKEDPDRQGLDKQGLDKQGTTARADSALDSALEAGLDPIDHAQLALALAGALGTQEEELRATLALLEQLGPPAEGNDGTDASHLELTNRAIRLAVTTRDRASLDRLSAYVPAWPHGVSTTALALGRALVPGATASGLGSSQNGPLVVELERSNLGPLAVRALGLLRGRPSATEQPDAAQLGTTLLEEDYPRAGDALLFERARRAISTDAAAVDTAQASGAPGSSTRALRDAAEGFRALAQLTETPALTDGLLLRAALEFASAGDAQRGASILEGRSAAASDEPLAVAQRWLERATSPGAFASGESSDLTDFERVGQSLMRAYGESDGAASSDFVDDTLAAGSTKATDLLALLVALNRGGDALEERVNTFAQLDEGARGALLFGASARRGDDLTRSAGAWLSRDDSPAAQLACTVAARRSGDTKKASALERSLADSVFGHTPDQLALAWQRAEAVAASSNPGSDAAWSTEPTWPSALAELGQALGRSADGDLTMLLAGVAELGSGNHVRAIELLEPLESTLDDDPTLLTCLSYSARATGRSELEARVTEQLARLATEPHDAARLWERVGELAESLGDTKRAEAAFSAALGRDSTSRVAFARLYSLAQAAGDRARLVDLLELRLDADPSSLHRAELLWTSARYQWALGRRAGALRALMTLLELEPTHLPGNALHAEFLLTDGAHEQALLPLETVARHPDTPEDARLRATRAAIEIQERLGRPSDALGLARHVESLAGSVGYLGSPDWQRTRARLLARVGDFEGASSALRRLIDGEDHVQTRLDDARLLLAIERDHHGDPARTLEAARHVLRDAPGDRDATDVVLSADLAPRDKRSLLSPELDATLSGLRREPLDVARVRRLVALAAASDAAEYERVALGMLELIARLDDPERARLDGLLRAGKTMPHAALPFGALDVVLPSAQKGSFANFLTAAGPAISAATAPSLAALGVGMEARIAAEGSSARLAETSAWAHFVGALDHELYVGGSDPERVLVVPGRVHQVVLGAAVPAPLDVTRRARLGALLFSARAGTLPLVAMPLHEACAWLRAAANIEPTAVGTVIGSTVIGGTVIGGAEGDEALDDHEERRSALSRSLSASDIIALEELAADVARAGNHIDELAIAARTSALSVAALVAGTPSIVRHLRDLLPTDDSVRRRVIGDVLRFSISPEFFELRREAGLDT